MSSATRWTNSAPSILKRAKSGEPNWSGNSMVALSRRAATGFRSFAIDVAAERELPRMECFRHRPSGRERSPRNAAVQGDD